MLNIASFILDIDINEEKINDTPKVEKKI